MSDLKVLCLGKPVAFTGELNIARIVSTWWGDRMDTATCRAFTDKSDQGEFCTAPLAESSQATAGYRLIPEITSMRLVDKFNEFSAFGVGSCIAAVI